MTARAFAQVSVRVWGVILIISAATWASNITMLFEPEPGLRATFIPMEVRTVAAFYWHLVIELVAGIFLVRNGDSFGAWLTSDIEETGPPADSKQLQIAAVAILGAYFLVTGLAQLAGYGYAYSKAAKLFETPSFEYAIDRDLQNIASGVVRVLAGTLLIVGRNGISRWWTAIRGRQEENVTDA